MPNDKLLYTALIFLQGCCANTPTETLSTTHTDPLLKRVWMLKEVPSIPFERLVQSQARLDLTQLPHAVIHVGCHHFDLRVQMENGHFRAQTFNNNPFCQQETALAEHLQHLIYQAKSYRVEGHFLILTTKQGVTLRLVAQDWD